MVGYMVDNNSIFVTWNTKVAIGYGLLKISWKIGVVLKTLPFVIRINIFLHTGDGFTPG